MSNGRNIKLWLDAIKKLGYVIDWAQVDKTEYLLAMERSPVKDLEIKYHLKEPLTDKMNDGKV